MQFDCGLACEIGGGPDGTAGQDVDFDGAVRDRFHTASAGTLFLDRIEMMSDGAQATLLSLLDARVLHHDGTERTEPRIITGASRSLLAAVSSGAFNATLFYRLNVVHLDFTKRNRRGELMKVRDLMSTPAQTCRLDADLGAIAWVMWTHDCGFVPLMDASDRVAGVVTDRDICIATATRHRLPESISAAEMITGPVHTCRPDDTVNVALATMKEFKVRRLPVIDTNGRLQGVISMNDIVLASDRKRKPTSGDVVSAMAAICAHRPTETIASAGL